MYKQLAYSGTMEVTEIRKAGLNVRRPLKQFYQYYKICASDQQAMLEGASFTERTKILLDQLPLDKDMYRVGKTIMFLRNAEILDELDAIREVKAVEHMIHLQSLMRMVRQRQQYMLLRTCALRIQGAIKSFEIRRAYLDVQKVTLLVQQAARTHLASRKLRSMMHTGDRPSKEEIVATIKRTLYPARHEHESTRLASHESMSNTPTFHAIASGLLQVRLDKEAAPSTRWCVVRHGTLTIYTDELALRDVLCTFDLAHVSMDMDEGSVGMGTVTVTKHPPHQMASCGKTPPEDPPDAIGGVGAAPTEVHSAGTDGALQADAQAAVQAEAETAPGAESLTRVEDAESTAPGREGCLGCTRRHKEGHKEGQPSTSQRRTAALAKARRRSWFGGGCRWPRSCLAKGHRGERRREQCRLPAKRLLGLCHPPRVKVV